MTPGPKTPKNNPQILKLVLAQTVASHFTGFTDFSQQLLLFYSGHENQNQKHKLFCVVLFLMGQLAGLWPISRQHESLHEDTRTQERVNCRTVWSAPNLGASQLSSALSQFRVWLTARLTDSQSCCQSDLLERSQKTVMQTNSGGFVEHRLFHFLEAGDILYKGKQRATLNPPCLTLTGTRELLTLENKSSRAAMLWWGGRFVFTKL